MKATYGEQPEKLLTDSDYGNERDSAELERGALTATWRWAGYGQEPPKRFSKARLVEARMNDRTHPQKSTTAQAASLDSLGRGDAIQETRTPVNHR